MSHKDSDIPQHDRPSTAIDTAIFTILEDRLCVLTIKRANEPFKDVWSLVGGVVDINIDKNIEDTAKRKLKEKTGVNTPYLEQLKTVGNPTRDPRGWSISTIYFALIPSANVKLVIGQGASEIKWSPIQTNGVNDKLAFDHQDILKDCLERLRNKLLYTSLPIYLLSEEFTLSELQKVYETILGKKLERKSFRRRMLNAGIIKDTGKMKQSGRRPAKVYELSVRDNAHYFERTIGGKCEYVSEA